MAHGPRQERRTALIQIADVVSGIILLLHTSAMDRFPKKAKGLYSRIFSLLIFGAEAP